MMGNYGRRFAKGNRAKVNPNKLQRARELDGKYVEINGIMRPVVGVEESTGEILVRIGGKDQTYNPLSF
jgi:hypothetical protein